MGGGGEIKTKKRGEWGLKDGRNEREGKKPTLGIWARERKIRESDMSTLRSQILYLPLQGIGANCTLDTKASGFLKQKPTCE